MTSIPETPVNRAELPQILPAILGSLCQQKAEGILVLEQNDGCRRLYWTAGHITYLQSDVAGEQFGNYLLRQGILDYPSLSELLANDERFRLGEKVIQWGLMSIQERDLYLRALQEQVMVHALEHPIVQMEWKPGLVQQQLSEDLRFEVDHRHFVWSTLHEAGNLQDTCDLLYQEAGWKWTAPSGLLDSLSDLPFTPQTAYAMSFLGAEPVGFETFQSLSGLPEGEAARLIMTLWALGSLTLTEGELPKLIPAVQVASLELPLPASEVLVTNPLPFEARPVPAQQPPDESIPAVAFPTYADIPAMAAPSSEAVHESPAVHARKCFIKAKNLLIQDRTAEAIRMLEQSVKLDPEGDHAYEPWLLLGKHRAANPAWSTRAIEALQAASRLRPKAAEPWALMGEVYHRKSFKANAKACFKKALELDPSVAVPADVDLKDDDTEPGDSGGLFRKFKAILGGRERES